MIALYLREVYFPQRDVGFVVYIRKLAVVAHGSCGGNAFVEVEVDVLGSSRKPARRDGRRRRASATDVGVKTEKRDVIALPGQNVAVASFEYSGHRRGRRI